MSNAMSNAEIERNMKTVKRYAAAISISDADMRMAIDRLIIDTNRKLEKLNAIDDEPAIEMLKDDLATFKLLRKQYCK